MGKGLPAAWQLAGKDVYSGMKFDPLLYGEIKKFDPSATVQSTYAPNIEGSNDNPWQTTISFDTSKLPKSVVGDTSNWITAGPGKLYDPSKIVNDPNYGPLTPQSNVDASMHGLSAIGWTVAPLLPMAAFTFGVGGLAAAGAGAGAGAGAAPTSAEMLGIRGFTTAANMANTGVFDQMLGNAKASNALPPAPSLAPPPAPAAAAAAPAKPPATELAPTLADMQTYTPENFGNAGGLNTSGSQAQVVSDGSQPVATAIAPDAYGSSSQYSQVIT